MAPRTAQLQLAAALLAALLPLASAELSALSSAQGGGGGVAIDGATWFSPGNVSVTVGGVTHSTADGTLEQSGTPTTDKGSDTLGDYSITTKSWSAGGTPFETSEKIYDGGRFIVYTQTFPKGAAATAAPGGADVSSCYPSLDPTPADGEPKGWLSFQGRFMEGSKGGPWQVGGRGGPGMGTGDFGGPFVVFGQPMNQSLVVSPVSNFMAATLGSSPASGDDSLCLGLDAAVESVPAGAHPPCPCNGSVTADVRACGSRRLLAGVDDLPRAGRQPRAEILRHDAAPQVRHGADGGLHAAVARLLDGQRRVLLLRLAHRPRQRQRLPGNTQHHPRRFRTLFYRRSSLNHVVRHGVVRMR